ncbi:MAG: hypothetical protein L0Y55_06425 [Anaerolineales bacterium]|nr:hypothetical protein [Anaerolineales bacterium]
MDSPQLTDAATARRAKIISWIGPGFLLALVVIFLLLPFPLMDKLHGICFGI